MLAVVGVTALLTFIISALWTSVEMESQIVSNKYRISQAKLAAQSGISHFVALNIEESDIIENIAIPETRLSSKTAYRVEAISIGEDKMLVISTGIYKKSGQKLFEYPIRAIFHPY